MPGRVPERVVDDHERVEGQEDGGGGGDVPHVVRVEHAQRGAQRVVGARVGRRFLEKQLYI